MAFTAIAALVAAPAITVTMVLGAMAEVGAVMSIVGAVTGNKDLVKIGGAIGLVGGVGGLITGAASAASAGVAGNLAQEGFRASEIAAQNAAGSVASNAAVAAASPEVMGSAGVTSAPATPGVSGVADVGLSPPPNTPAPLPTDVAGPAAVAGPGDVGAQYATKPAIPTNGSAKGNSFFSGVFDYIKDPANKEIINTGVKVVGGALEGMQKADEFDRVQGLRENEFAYRQSQDANVRQQNTSRSGIIQRARA